MKESTDIARRMPLPPRGGSNPIRRITSRYRPSVHRQVVHRGLTSEALLWRPGPHATKMVSTQTKPPSLDETHPITLPPRFWNHPEPVERRIPIIPLRISQLGRFVSSASFQHIHYQCLAQAQRNSAPAVHHGWCATAIYVQCRPAQRCAIPRVHVRSEGRHEGELGAQEVQAQARWTPRHL